MLTMTVPSRIRMVVEADDQFCTLDELDVVRCNVDQNKPDVIAMP